MAVTDLTGTTWTLNDTPTTTYNELYNINFISNGFDWTKLFLSGVIGYGWAGHSSYGMYHIAYMPAHTVSIPFFANQNYLLYYSETENIDWKSIQLTYSSDKHPDGLSDYQYISLKPNTRYALCPYRTDGRWVAGPAIGHQNDGSDSNFLVVSKFSTSTFNMSDFLSTIKYPNYTSTLTPVSSSYVSNSDTSHSIVTAYTTPSAGFTATEFKTIIITGGTDATNTTLISWLEANATQILPTSFKRYYKNTRLIGTGTYKFRPYTVIQPQLSTPANISADGTTVSWDEVENATSYAVLADGSEIGTVEKEKKFYADENTAQTFRDWADYLYSTVFNSGTVGVHLFKGYEAVPHYLFMTSEYCTIDDDTTKRTQSMTTSERDAVKAEIEKIIALAGDAHDLDSIRDFSKLNKYLETMFEFMGLTLKVNSIVGQTTYTVVDPKGNILVNMTAPITL